MANKSLYDLTSDQLQTIRQYHERILAATTCADRQRRARVSIARIDRELASRVAKPEPTAWECADCGNEYDAPKKPGRCGECGGRRLIAQDIAPIGAQQAERV